MIFDFFGMNNDLLASLQEDFPSPQRMGESDKEPEERKRETTDDLLRELQDYPGEESETKSIINNISTPLKDLKLGSSLEDEFQSFLGGTVTKEEEFTVGELPKGQDKRSAQVFKAF